MTVIPHTPTAAGAFTAAATDSRPALPAAKAPALLLIDIQKRFCDPAAGHRGNDATLAVARRIAALAPTFRAAGVPFYPVYTPSRHDPDGAIDHCEFVPLRRDNVLHKSTNSAFESSAIKSTLSRRGHHTLLVCGFNLNACVFDTVYDAVSADFAVWLLQDLVGNDNYNSPDRSDHFIGRMRDIGVTLTDSDAALTVLSHAHERNRVRERARRSRAPH